MSMIYPKKFTGILCLFNNKVVLSYIYHYIELLFTDANLSNQNI